MKLYKHTLVSAALVLTGLGSAQAQTATCPIGMALVYTALTHIPFCVGVPSNVIGTGSSTGSSTGSAANSSSSSAAASFSAGSAAEDYIPVRPLAATGIFSTTPAAPGQTYTNQDIATFLRDNGSLGAQQALSILGISPEQLAESQALMAAERTSTFTDAQVASYLRDNNLIGDDYGTQKAAAVFGISPTQLAAAKALLVPGNTAGLVAVNSANNGYWNQVNASPGQERRNIEWETAHGLTPNDSHLAEYEAKIPGTATYGLTYTDQQVANFIQANGAQQATSVLGVTPQQLAAAQSLLTSGNTVTLVTAPASAMIAAQGLTYTDQQVANFIKANGPQQALSVLRVTPEQLAAAQSLLDSGNTVTLVNAPASATPAAMSPIVIHNNATPNIPATPLATTGGSIMLAIPLGTPGQFPYSSFSVAINGVITVFHFQNSDIATMNTITTVEEETTYFQKMVFRASDWASARNDTLESLGFTLTPPEISKQFIVAPAGTVLTNGLWFLG